MVALFSSMKLATASLVLAPWGAAAAAGLGNIPSFDAFLQGSSRTYAAGSAEYAARRSLYERRAASAAAQNARSGRSWTAGVNDFWDRTDEELAGLWGWRGSARPDGTSGGSVLRPAHAVDFLQEQPASLPKEKNWKELHAMKHIRDQGNCGSCWAIATSTVLQAHAEIHTGQVRTFSPQQIVSCVPNPRKCGGSGGCEGATIELALDWVMHNGCPEEKDVPYTAETGRCQQISHPAASPSFLSVQKASLGGASFGMRGWEKLPENEYMPLMRALVEQGPVGISVAAKSWLNYESGIFDGCSKDAVIDHAVVLIGYGEEGDKKYWLIQNSWGRNWGEDGTIRLLRRDSEEQECGIDGQPELGTACEGGPKKVTVCGMCGILYDSAVPHFA